MVMNMTSRSRTAIGATFVVSLLLVGCNSQTVGQNNSNLTATNYQLRHPIVVTEQPETLDLPVGAHMRNLNGPLRGTVKAFGADSRKKGNGRVEILVPSGGRNEAAVHALVPQIRSSLKAGGLSGGAISTRSYAVDNPSADAPIRLSYPRIQATAGPCGTWNGDIGRTFNRNVDYENYGCATQSNLAAMVENPSDLLTPRASAPADRMRRANVVEKYRAGEATASSVQEGLGTQVSDQ